VIHYTINTAHQFNLRSKPFDSGVLELMRVWSAPAVQEGQANLRLPDPYQGYSAKITFDNTGAALFDLLDSDGLPITVNAVAWTESGQEAVWPLFESLYLKLSGQFETLSISRAPTLPETIPWLTTLILPNPRGVGLNWVADFEQCLALTFLPPKPPKTKPKGFR
jgi:hypothetical protein